MAPLNLYDITIPQQIHMLETLSTILTKVEKQVETQTPPSTLGADKPLSLDNLAETRVAPDMRPFPYQICTACNSAKLCATRVADVPNVEQPDTETTLPELHARIAKTIEFLQGVKREDFEGKETKEIEMRGFQFTGVTYVTQFALPNFYFHLTTTYTLLRGMGFDLGKKDFLGANNLKMTEMSPK